MSIPVNGHTNGVSQDQLDKILEPEFNHDSFVFGKYQDGSPRTWKLQPLPWKHEKNFRKQVMPMLAVSYRPFELLLKNISRDFVAQMSGNVVGEVFAAEQEVDEYLTRCMHAILIAQDDKITQQWVDDNAQSRDQMLEIIYQQCELHHVMDRLGELLAERLTKLARTMGIDLDLPSLKQLWKQVSALLSERITQVASAVGNATGPYTGNILETGSHPLNADQTSQSDVDQVQYHGPVPVA
jgi:hypothetical protein